jgi:hypothetical protein
MSVLYDKKVTLSDNAESELQRMIGSLMDEARVRFTPVLIDETTDNLYSLAKRNGGGEDEGHIPLVGVTQDFFDITGGRRLGDDQMMVVGIIRSTGEEGWLFLSPRDEREKEMIILEPLTDEK